MGKAHYLSCHLIARLHIGRMGCAHLSLKFASVPGAHSGETTLGTEVHGGEGRLSVQQERILFIVRRPRIS